MSNKRGRAQLAAVVFAAMAVSTLHPLVGTATAAGNTPKAGNPWCTASGPIDASVAPVVITPESCNLTNRVVVDGIIGVAVPERGAAAFGFLHGTVESESFGMIRRADGTVELQGVGSTTIQQGATGAPSSQPDSDYVQPEGMDVDSGGLTANTDSPGGSGDECIDTTRGTYGFRESDVHEWWMNWTSIPDYFGLSDSTVVDRIREGGVHITNETTDCTNFRPNYPINLDYKGSTSANTDMGWVDGSFVCWPSQNPRDGQNTIDFGDMPPTFAAGTCNYRHSYSSTELTESDIRINEDQGDVRFYATNGKPSSCDSRYDLEGIVTHERGHTFGLVDLLYSSHPDLTMRDMAPGSCSRELRTLGLGDLYGLNDLYA